MRRTWQWGKPILGFRNEGIEKDLNSTHCSTGAQEPWEDTPDADGSAIALVSSSVDVEACHGHHPVLPRRDSDGSATRPAGSEVNASAFLRRVNRSQLALVLCTRCGYRITAVGDKSFHSFCTPLLCVFETSDKFAC